MNYYALNYNHFERERWLGLLNNSINGNHLNSIQYLDIYRSKGWEVTSYLFENDLCDAAGVHFLLRGYFKNSIKVASVNSGFIFRKEPETDLLNTLLTFYIQWAKSKNVSFLRINPVLPQIINGNRVSYSKDFHDILLSNGFKPLQNVDHTYWIDLKLSEEELLKKMKKQTRYEVRKGLKSEIKVERYDSFNEEIFFKFWELYHSLGKTKEFSTMSRQEFYLLNKTMLDSELASIFVLRYQHVIINISLCGKLNIGAYMYGAINPEFKLINECPSPGQIAQWKMITYLKSKGIKYYDLGFCPGPVPSKGHPQYNIWNFKYGFGGDQVELMPIYIRILKPLSGKLIEALMKLR